MITVGRQLGTMSVSINGDVGFKCKMPKLAGQRTHREIGPARITHSGYVQYITSGLLHREGGAAVIWPNGRRFYYIHGQPIDPDVYFLKYGVL